MSLQKTALLAALLSLAANLLILHFTKPLAPNFMTLSVGPVSFWTILGTAGAGGVFALIRKWSSHPVPVFVIVAAVVLLFSFIPDVMVLHTTNPMFKGSTPASVGVLMLMHVVVAVINVPLLLRSRRLPSPAPVAS